MSDQTKRIILVTGTRQLAHLEWIPEHDLAHDALEFEVALFGRENVLLVHGAAEGWDRVYHRAADACGIHIRPFPADQHADPLARNEAMVALVLELSQKYPSKPACWAHARDWKSGTGHCARRARKAGIPTTDYGVSTV